MRTVSGKPEFGILLAVVALTVGCATDRATSVEGPPAAEAAVRTWALPTESGFTRSPADPPFYARIERPYVAPNDGYVAAVVFYRSPDCVPHDFNLLDLLDIPAAFSCPLTVAGTEWYENNAPPFMPPYLSVLRHAPQVPVWIVDWNELNAAASDDVLTIGELRSLPSLDRGSATDFYEWLEPFPTRDPSLLMMEAAGTLPRGRRFELRYREDQFVITSFRLRIF
jgi:hypothetical protein